MERDIRFCTTDDGVTIAYALSGAGERVFVHTPNVITASIQLDGVPGRREWLTSLGERFRVVEYDSRGTGLSQRDCANLTMDSMVDDLTAVVDAVGAESVILFGYLGGSYPASRYAVNHPARVSHLVLWPPPLIEARAGDNGALARLAISNWETFTEVYAHTALGWAQGERAHTFARLMRDTVERDAWLRFMADTIRKTPEEYWEHARQINVPTLVLQRKGYPHFPLTAGKIRGVTIRMVAGESAGPYVEHADQVLAAIFEFTKASPLAPVQASQSSGSSPSGMAVILFTDIADSTALTERVGDAAFRAASRTLEDGIRAAMVGAGGKPVEGRVLGDGVMATFTSAAQAIDAARRCLDLSAGSELALHVGLHAGDVIRERDNVYGGAVNIASRVCALCEPGEILVSQTVRDLARTSANVTFEDRGEHLLKGIADSVRVFAVRQN